MVFVYHCGGREDEKNEAGTVTSLDHDMCGHNFIVVTLALLAVTSASSFSFPRPRPPPHHHPSSSSRQQSTASGIDAGATDATAASRDDEERKNNCRVLLMDHLNINHEKGKHDALKAFYFDFLGCSVDPRKYANYLEGKNTLWANAGLHQFHLPEGNPHAQVFNGMITLIHEDLDGLMEKYNEYLDGDERYKPLKETEFLVGIVGDDDDDDMMLVTDPWGTEFCILPSDDPAEDRAAHIGSQPVVDVNGPSRALAMEDITVYVSHDVNLDGIGRFYEHILGAWTIDELSSEASICIAMGERQTLTFQYHPDGPETEIFHHDFGHDQIMKEIEADTDATSYQANFGPHISLYVTNIAEAYSRAEKLGVLYVNTRFKRLAYTQDDAIDQCMFRLFNIIDPLDDKREIILRLEHEVRSVTTREGKKYNFRY